MQFTTDFQEKDIVFGGDKKLEKVIDEINELFPLAKDDQVDERSQYDRVRLREGTSRYDKRMLLRPFLPEHWDAAQIQHLQNPRQLQLIRD